MCNGHSLNSGKYRASKQSFHGFSTWGTHHTAPVLPVHSMSQATAAQCHTVHLTPTCQWQHSQAPRPCSRSSTAISSPSGCAPRTAHSARTATMAPSVLNSSVPCPTWHPSTQLLQQHGPAQRSCATGEWDGSSGVWRGLQAISCR